MPTTTKPEDALIQLLALSEQLPDGLRADWMDSNHFELSCHSDEYFWLELAELFNNEHNNWCKQELGKRVGLVMDIAATLKKAEPMLRRLCEDQREASDAGLRE